MRVMIIGAEQKAALAVLRQRAADDPVDVTTLDAIMKLPVPRARHRTRMTALTISIPMGYLVTFSIESGHPVGVCRHLSVSVDTEEMLPNPYAVKMVAEELGFVDVFGGCTVWKERFEERGVAINVVQPVSYVAASHA